MESVSHISTLIDPLEAAQAVGARFKTATTSKSIPFVKLKALLDSRSDRDITDGLRRVIGLIYQNKPCLPYFSSVVKNVANPNIEVKKLVYIYLLHYAESDPDLALLSVNAIQKSLGDQNPQIRAMALRTMAGMRVPVISQIVSLAIKKGVADLSPHVRKAAALAIPKCYALDPSTLPQLTDHLSVLLGDKQYFVVGPAAQTFLQLCPDRIDLLHKHYRGLVKKIIDMDEWGQLATLQILLTYARKCFPRGSYETTTVSDTKVNKKDFYDDDDENGGEVDTKNPQVRNALDPDLLSLLKSCLLLLSSRSSAIVVAASSCILYLGRKEHIEQIVGPLIALMRGSPEIQQVALPNIVLIGLKHADLFVAHASHFLINSRDTNQTWRLKLEMLTLIFPYAHTYLKTLILNELDELSHGAEVEQTQEAVRAIGRCAQHDEKSSSRCFKVLLNQITSFDNFLVSEVLTVMRHLIQRNPEAHRKTVVRLARNLDRTTSPEARATIVWLVGEFSGQDVEHNIAPDVLRILVGSFAEESEEAKQQIILLAAKVYLQYLQSLPEMEDSAQDGIENGFADVSAKIDGHPIPKIWSYLQNLVRYDTSYDLRDRMRLFRGLLSNPKSTQLASLLISAPKPVPYTPSPSETRHDLLLGSATLTLGRDIAGLNGLPGYATLPDWVEDGFEPDPSLRDELDRAVEEYVSQANKVSNVAASQRIDDALREQGLEQIVKKGTASGKGKTLDDWLAESEGEDETSEEEETDEEEEDSDEEETDSDDDPGQGLVTR